MSEDVEVTRIERPKQAPPEDDDEAPPIERSEREAEIDFKILQCLAGAPGATIDQCAFYAKCASHQEAHARMKILASESLIVASGFHWYILGKGEELLKRHAEAVKERSDG